MSQDLSKTLAIVTGASSGIGYSMAKALAEQGATVALAARTSFKLDEAAHRLKTDGYNAFAFPIDVRSEESIDEAVAWVKKEWGRVDLLVNNAGIGMKTVNREFLSKPQPFFKVSPESFRDLINTNLTGYFLVSRAVVPLMANQGKGKIVNISMNYETMKREGFIPYGPSRAATESLSHIMAEDLKPYHIDVNTLLPGGATDTGMIPDEYREEVKSNMMLLDPDIMKRPIQFLASDKSDGLTGERISAVDFEDWLGDKGLMY